MKFTGTIARGVKAPIIRKNDNLIEIVNNSLLQVVREDNVVLNDGDIICITESVVAISQNNFATTSQIAEDVNSIFGDETIGLVFPLLSRNRFSLLLKAIRKGVKKIILQLSFPADEVGNKLITDDDLFNSNINPYTDVLSSEEFRKIFKNTTHEYTGVDYIEFYQDIIGAESEIIFSNDPRSILKYTDKVIVGNIHNRKRTKDILLKAGAKKVVQLDEILNKSINGSGYNKEYGLLGSNIATDDSVKLFPRDSFDIVYNIQSRLKETFGKHIEVMIYGDGAFKDPKGGIWELADPVVSPGFTNGLLGTPNELKLKYIANNVSDEESMKKIIRDKSNNLVGKNESLGTTPRQIVDLLGSLADLTSGSGDKGTPFVLIQNYFTNYATE